MITAEQRQLRQQYIGSSDCPAILGLDPFRSAADVWLEKTGQAEPFDGNEHTDRGNLLEPVVIQWARDEIGVPFRRDIMQVAECGLIAANFDAIAHPGTEGFIVEAKTTVNPDEWGEAGTDQVPERVIAQVHHAMFVAGPEYRIAWVPVLMPGYRSFDFRLYKVERQDELAKAIAERGRQFMREHVAPCIPPSEYKPSIEVLKRVRREPAKVVSIADELVDNLIVAKAAKKQAEDDCEAAQRLVLTALGDAEAGTFSRGQVTYLETKRRGYVVEDSTYRQLRIRKAKGE